MNGNKSAVFLLFIALLLNTSTALATRWTLVDFGHDAASTLTPYSDWNQVLRHATYTTYVDPDGNPEHQGLAEIASVPDGQFAFFGIKGTTPIDFRRGHKIIATFYNRTWGDELLMCRISFSDENAPNPAEPSMPWFTMFAGHDGGSISDYYVPGHTLHEMEFYITDADILTTYDGQTTEGNHTAINLSLGYPTSAFVLTKIEFSDEADLSPPGAPSNLQARAISLTRGSVNSAVELTWSPADDGTDGSGIRTYFIYRDGQLYGSIAGDMLPTMGSEPYWRDLYVASGHTYEYQVSAVDKAPVGIHPTASHPENRHGNEGAKTAPVSVTVPNWSSNVLINPSGSLLYQGAFRLPHDPLEEDWAYAHRGLAYFPGGNPGHDPSSELPGSLYAYNLRDEIGEISIPKPVRSSNVSDLPRARTLTPLTDIFPVIYSCDGTATSTPCGGGASKRIGLGYHAAAGGVDERLYYSISNFYGTDPTAPSQGAFSLDLTGAHGAWHVSALPPDNVHPGLASGIVFSAPSDWAAAHTGGRSLIVGNTYANGCGVPSAGPSLYATAPWETGSLPANGGYSTSVELLRYSSGAATEHRNINYTYDQYGEGGAWLVAGEQAAVVISTRQNVGESWYGDTTGIDLYELNIPEPTLMGDHGTGVTDWRAGLLFYNPADLADVAAGVMQAWDPLPYVGYDLSAFSLKSNGIEEAGAIAFDSANGFLYFIERNGDPGYESGYSLIHVWKVSASTQLPGIVPVITQLLFEG